MAIGSADADRQFLSLAIQYYAAARSAAYARLQPVCGSLYHHAIEMFFKARLSQKYTLKQLRKFGRTGHELPPLWTAFKAEFPHASFAPFDDTIATLERFERVRYPDAILEEGAQMIILWGADSIPTSMSGSQPPPPRYEISVSDIDRLVATIFEACSRNPLFFAGGMNAYALAALTRDNPVGSIFLPTRLSQNDS